MSALVTPSKFGWPDATNTGPRGTLTPTVGGMDVGTNDLLIENLDINAVPQGYGIFINADSVTVRNCRIRTTPTPAGGCIRIAGGRAGILIEDCELIYEAAGTYDQCVSDAGYIMRRCHIHHVSEGPRMGDNTTIEDCYIHTLRVDDPEAHADALQSTGGSNIVLRHNTIVADQIGADFANSAVILGCEFAASDNVQVTDNLLDGGGFTLLMGPSAFPMSRALVSGNRFGRNTGFGPHSIGPGITDFRWNRNVFDDDGSTVAYL